MDKMTEKNGIIYIPALDGVAPVESAISLPDTEKGMLFLRGYPIDILTKKASFEEVIYLLLFGKLPTQKAFSSFQEKMKIEQNVPSKTINALKFLGLRTSLFDMASIGILSLAQYDSNLKNTTLQANYARALTLIAKTPILVAKSLMIKSGIEPNFISPELSPVANFMAILNIPANEEIIRAMEVGQILCSEHEMNASTLVDRTVASTGANIYSAVAAGLCAFSGEYHGGASQFIIEMLRQIGNPANVQKWVDDKLMAKNKKDQIIMGFGHRLYKGAGSDPRTAIFKKWALRLGKKKRDEALLETAQALEKYVGEKKNLCANVDCYFALVNHFIGFSPELSPLIYAMARVTGWVAHYIEQFHDPNGRILRPRAIYTGSDPSNLKWVDIKDR